MTVENLLSFKIGSGRAINIAKEIGAHHQSVGQCLLGEAVYRKLVANLANNGREVSGGAHEVLRVWVQGMGRQPVQWATLIEALRTTELTALANAVEQNLQLNT